jgi:hypothetical protein
MRLAAENRQESLGKRHDGTDELRNGHPPAFTEHNILAMSDSRHCRRGGIVAGITRRDAVLIVGDLPEGRACLNQPTEAV